MSLLESGTELDEKFGDELLSDAQTVTGLSAPLFRILPFLPDVMSYQTSGEAMEVEMISKTSAHGGAALADKSPFGLLSNPKPDHLSLFGLLNVLGVLLDTPGSILIMTSDHQEMLDPALSLSQAALTRSLWWVT
jgi:hypothetical protein